MPVRVLVVADDPVTCALLAEVLGGSEYDLQVAARGLRATELAASRRFDLALIDVWLPDVDGLEVLRGLRAVSPDTVPIVMTAIGSIDTTARAIQEGAFDFVSKPLRVEALRATIRRAVERRWLGLEGDRVTPECPAACQGEPVVGSSGSILEVYKTIALVAATRSTVVIRGETGTGKELIARAIHRHSSRRDGPFITIDCSALAESLLESELFGHARGAFTGAATTRKGLFEAAHGGTCLLDEIGEMGLSAQARLLRVLQEHEVRRVGSTESVTVDVRILAATNLDLEQLMAEGRFREDLFYRLSVVTIRVPPLRERREDIPLLAEHFLRKYAAEHAKPVAGIAPEAMHLLVSAEWPGNVREFEHAVERAVALATTPVLLPEDLFPASAMVAPGPPATPTLREVVKRHIRQTLTLAQGNKTRAAQLLGIPRRTLYRLAHRYGIDLGKPG